MPYDSVDSLPDYIKKKPAKKQRQWMAVWNSSYKSCMMQDGGDAKSCETEAFRKANGVIKGAEMADAAAFNLIRLEKTDPKVNYEPAKDGSGKMCGNCRFFADWGNQGSGDCSLVEGSIEATYVCNLWAEQLPSQQIGAMLSDAGAWSEKAFQIYVEATEIFKDHDFTKPDWYPYLPKPGKYSHPTYGEVEITHDTNKALVDSVNNQVYQDSIPMDAEHETKLSGAVGWITKLRMNDDGSADAYIEWTKRGQDLLAGGQFKYVSPEWWPAWRDPATGVIHRNVVAGGAITTRPFFKDKVLRALVAGEVVPTGQYAEDSMKTCASCGHKYAEGMSKCPECGSTKVASEGGNVDPKDDKGKGAGNEPKTYTEGSPELQKILDEAKAEARKAAEAEFKAKEPAADPTKTTEYTEIKAELEAAKTLAASEKTAREQLAGQVKTMQDEARERRFRDLVAGRGGANDGGAWAGDAETNVKTLTQMAEAFGEDSETFASFVKSQTEIAGQLKAAALFTEIGHGRAVPVKAGEAGIDELVKKYREAHPDKTEAQAFAEVMETPEAKRLYEQGAVPKAN